MFVSVCVFFLFTSTGGDLDLIRFFRFFLYVRRNNYNNGNWQLEMATVMANTITKKVELFQKST